jgi:Uma2 family endonuclease
MSNLTLKGIPGDLHQRLRDASDANRRSLNGEVIHRLERSLELDLPTPSLVREEAVASYLAGVTRPAAKAETLTLDEFIALPDGDPFRLELAAGRLVREPAPGFRHGRVAARINRLLWEAGQQPGHGEVFFDTGFLMVRDPPTVRIPDVAFVSASRLAENETDEVFLPIAPDLAVEVLSASNSASDIQRKAFEYLDAGAVMVWIVDPSAETVTVYRARDDIRVRVAGETLDGRAAVPGLLLEVAALFG